jgi:hypothetical protein
MTPVSLPTEKFYISVDEKVLNKAMSRIEEQFRDLLDNGAQAEGVPPGFYAAGQHLNPYSLNQRGFYGTSAALLTISRSRPSPNRIGMIEGLIKYINDRPDIEQGLQKTEEDRAMLPARLILDWKSAFKCADLAYALAAAPPAVAGREMLLRGVLQRLDYGRRKAGGWAVDLDPNRDRDPLATASVIRGLHAAGMNVGPSDIDLVRSDALTVGSASPYVRCLCLLVLLEVSGPDDSTAKVWKDLLDTLKSELHDRTEANYEFTIGNRQYYVRVPWQLYLIAGASICRPMSLIFTSDIRRALLGCVKAVDSSEGYVYTAFGHMKSTRTYSILMDTLWRVDKQLQTSKVLARMSVTANWAIRILYARPSAWIALLAALALAGLGIYAWLRGSSSRLDAVGPELAVAALLGLISFLLSRVRSRGK